jgi:hypothetical protein
VIFFFINNKIKKRFVLHKFVQATNYMMHFSRKEKRFTEFIYLKKTLLYLTLYSEKDIECQSNHFQCRKKNLFLNNKTLRHPLVHLFFMTIFLSIVLTINRCLLMKFSKKSLYTKVIMKLVF